MIALVCFATMLSCGAGHCPSDPVPPPPTTTFDSWFASDTQSWVAGFAEYPVGQETFYELDSGLRPLPPVLDTSHSGFMLTGANHSDDLFMFLKRQVSGLKPNTDYTVVFNVEFGSNVGKGCAGIGGSPGEEVWIKAGATVVEPLVNTDSFGSYYLLSINKGNQSIGGKDAVVIGDFANDTTCMTTKDYRLKLLNQVGHLDLRTDATGTAWLLVGTDSGFEGTTTIYFTRIRATFQEK
jgi:hypothetical protein